MRLQELSEKSGMTTASIKFYLREGLLPPGEKVNATLAVYGPQHLERLETIRTLRQTIGLGLGSIRTILELVDLNPDSASHRLHLLEVVQTAVLGLDDKHSVDSPAGDFVIRRQGWPDVETSARSALNLHLESMSSLGIDVSDDVLGAYADAVDSVAGVDITGTGTGSVDQMVRFAAVGIHLYSQLLLKMLALAQASHSIRRFGGPHDMRP